VLYTIAPEELTIDLKFVPTSVNVLAVKAALPENTSVDTSGIRTVSLGITGKDLPTCNF
jgi:hypothetical protein